MHAARLSSVSISRFVVVVVVVAVCGITNCSNARFSEKTKHDVLIFAHVQEIQDKATETTVIVLKLNCSRLPDTTPRASATQWPAKSKDG